MSTLTPPKSISKRKELRQDKVVTVYARLSEFFYGNRMMVYGILAGLVVVAGGLVLYFVMQGQRNDRAQTLLGSVVRLYEQGDYRAALDGAAGNPGLTAIVEEYGGTEAGNLAHFYAGDAHFRLGEYEQALRHFEAFKGGNHFVGASALEGQASIHEMNGNFERAGDLYRRGATEFESTITSPYYLLKAGRAYEKAGAYQKAHDAYTMIEETYPESGEAQEIEFHKARVAVKLKSS